MYTECKVMDNDGAESPVVRDAIKRNLSAYYAGNIEPHSFAMSPAEWEELIKAMK